MPKISRHLEPQTHPATKAAAKVIASGNLPVPAHADYYVERSDSIAQNIHLWRDRPAIVKADEVMTFGELDEQADKIASLMLAAAEHTEKSMVGIFTHVNLPQFFAIALACRRSGISYTNFVNTIEPADFIKQLSAYPYRLLFADEPMLHRIRDYIDDIFKLGIGIIGLHTHRRATPNLPSILGHISRPRAALPDESPRKYMGPVLYTSGTVKEAQRIHVKPGETSGAVANKFFHVGPDDIHLVIGKLYHGAALSWAQGHLKRGARIVLADNYGFKFIPAKILRLIEKEKITTLWICPSWLQLLIEEKMEHPDLYNTSSLRNIYVSAAPFHSHLKRNAINAFGSIFYDNYATTETGSISILKPDEMSDNILSVGIPLPSVSVNIHNDDGNQLAIGKIGRVTASTPMTHPEFVETGDDGYIDDKGFLHIVGRTSERIYINGEIIYPRILEEEITSYSCIRECHVVWNQEDPHRLSIFIIPKKGLRPNLRELEQAIREGHQFGDNIKLDIYQLNNLPRKPYKIDHKKLSYLVKEYNSAKNDITILEAALGTREKNPFTPQQLVDYFKNIPWLSELWGQIASPQFNLTLEQHTLRVLNQYEQYFKSDKHQALISPVIMRLILCLHDLGKPIAVREENSNKEHTETTLLIQRTFSSLGINPEITNFACTLVSFVFGHFIRGVRLITRMTLALEKKKTDLIPKFEELIESAYDLTPDEAKQIIADIKQEGQSTYFLAHLKKQLIEKIKDKANKIGISAATFFDILMMYHQCDASTYTTASHNENGLNISGKLDDLFIIDRPKGIIEYSEPIKSFTSEVRDELVYESQDNLTLNKILEPVFMPSHLGQLMGPLGLSR